jgi:hypothetical protein
VLILFSLSFVQECVLQTRSGLLLFLVLVLILQSGQQMVSPPKVRKRQQRSPLQSHFALGFSTTKHQQFNVGTKLLLGTSIYDTPVAEEVKGHMFVYEIVEFLENGKQVCLKYKNQVIKDGGNTFRVYKESEEAQVSFVFSCCSLFPIQNAFGLTFRFFFFVFPLHYATGAAV